MVLFTFCFLVPESSTHIPDDVAEQIISDWFGDEDLVQGNIIEDMETSLNGKYL